MGAYSDLDQASKEDIDAAKRLSDIVNNIVVFQPLDVVVRSWIAVRLSDGGYDGTLYDTRRDAVRHQQGNEQQRAYLSLRFAQGGMPVREAYVFLKYHRDAVAAHDKGIRIIDPEAPNGGHDPMMPITNEEVRAELRNFRRQVALRKRG